MATKHQHPLPVALYTAEQCRALDRCAIEQAGIPGFRLMMRAGRALFAELMRAYPAVHSVTVLCGRGNNGGDGLVLAALALQQGMRVDLRWVCEGDYPSQLRGEAAQAWSFWCSLGGEGRPYRANEAFEGSVIVDALLGTGVNGALSGLMGQAVEQINRSGLPVLAADIPSGLCSDTGQVCGVAVRANITLSFIGLKQGLFTHQGVSHAGVCLFDDLKVPDEVYEQVPVSAFRTTLSDLREVVSVRDRAAHKGSFGHVLVVGGDTGMGGAAILAAEAAARSGAGLVTLATRPEHLTAALVRAPHIMSVGIHSVAQLDPLLERASVVVLGPGLGVAAWGEQLFDKVLQSGKPLVVDADALNLVSIGRRLKSGFLADAILTPHPGEAARLLGCSIETVQEDRFTSLQQLQQQSGATVILKGAGTLVGDGDAVYLCDRGNPGMAAAGMGDLLAGIVAGLWAQHLSTLDASRLAVFLHAMAADRAAEKGSEVGLVATDLLAELAAIFVSDDEV